MWVWVSFGLHDLLLRLASALPPSVPPSMLNQEQQDLKAQEDDRGNREDLVALPIDASHSTLKYR